MQEFLIFYLKNTYKYLANRTFRILDCELGRYSDHAIRANDGLWE